MKRQIKSLSGVTLLEIMLVLAIASMVILMSVRYYKNATSSQQSEALLEQVQVVSGAADSLAQGFSGYLNVTTANVSNVLGGTSYLNYPWGSISLTGTATGYTATLSGTIPPGVCAILANSLSANAKYTVAATCGTIGYDSTK